MTRKTYRTDNPLAIWASQRKFLSLMFQLWYQLASWLMLDPELKIWNHPPIVLAGLVVDFAIPARAWIHLGWKLFACKVRVCRKDIAPSFIAIRNPPKHSKSKGKRDCGQRKQCLPIDVWWYFFHGTYLRKQTKQDWSQLQTSAKRPNLRIKVASQQLVLPFRIIKNIWPPSILRQYCQKKNNLFDVS